MLSDKLVQHIESLKDRLLKDSGFNPTENKNDFSYDAPNGAITTRLFITQGEGKSLREKLVEYRKDLLSIDPFITTEFQNSLPLDLSYRPSKGIITNNGWAEFYFNNVQPCVALLFLSKLVNNIKVSENKVLEFCHEKGSSHVHICRFPSAFVSQNSTLLRTGEVLEITTAVGEIESQAKTKTFVDNKHVNVYEDGLAHYKIKVTKPGKYTASVKVMYFDQDGKPTTEIKYVEYTVVD